MVLKRRTPRAPARIPARDARSMLAAGRQRAARGRRRRRWIVLWTVIGLVVSVLSFGAGLLAAPINYSFKPPQPQPVYLLDDRGHVFAEIEPPQQQIYVQSDQIPTVLKEAFIDAEDKDFYSEGGIDPIAIGRAAWGDLTGGTYSGASTITQQYVKDVYSGTTASRTPLRKLREAALAIRLDEHLSKNQILTDYLNNVYLGNGTVGVQAASRFYFGVSVDRLGYDASTHTTSSSLALARAAMLAGIVPAPSDWNPVADAAQARVEQIRVLNRMVADSTISSATASAADAPGLPKIVARSQKAPFTRAPQFRDIIAQQLTSAYTDDQLYESGGMQVTTTLDLRMQRAAQEAISQELPARSDPEAAVVAVDPRDGDVRAIAVKQNHYKPGGFSVASTEPNRSSGSTIKPFTLAEALEHGHTLDEVHYAPTSLRINSSYTVQNSDPAEAGDYTLERALADSVNTVYEPLALSVGLGRIVRLAKESGMEIGHEPGCHPLCKSEGLGVPVTPLSEADAYGVFVNGGIHNSPHFVLGVRTGAGELTAPNVKQPTGNRVMPAHVANQVKQAMGEVVTEGTGQSAAQPFPVYGKTGTTSRYTDAWFTGCTPTLCVTVWMGYDDGDRSMYHDGQPVYGGTVPAAIFAKFYADERDLGSGPTQPVTSSEPPAIVSVPPSPSVVTSGDVPRQFKRVASKFPTAPAQTAPSAPPSTRSNDSKR